MREWRRAPRPLRCGVTLACVIESGAPYRFETSMRGQRNVCIAHAGPVDQVQLEAYDHQQALRDAVAAPRTVSAGALPFACRDGKMAAAGDDV